MKPQTACKIVAFGEAGAGKVLEILQAELRLAMQIHGVRNGWPPSSSRSGCRSRSCLYNCPAYCPKVCAIQLKCIEVESSKSACIQLY